MSANDFLHIMAWGDVGFLINHAGLPLGRNSSGTHELSEDERRSRMWASRKMSDPCVRAIVPKMRRCDLDEMSFAFIQSQQRWAGIEKIIELSEID